MTVFGLGHTLAQAELSSRKSVFNPRHVFMADKMTLGQISVLSTSNFPYQHHCSCVSYSRNLSLTLHNFKNWQHLSVTRFENKHILRAFDLLRSCLRGLLICYRRCGSAYLIYSLGDVTDWLSRKVGNQLAIYDT